jgi:hypothetical protein
VKIEVDLSKYYNSGTPLTLSGGVVSTRHFSPVDGLASIYGGKI